MAAFFRDGFWQALALCAVLAFYACQAVASGDLRSLARAPAYNYLTNAYCNQFHKFEHRWCQQCAAGESFEMKRLQMRCEKAKLKAQKLWNLFPEPENQCKSMMPNVPDDAWYHTLKNTCKPGKWIEFGQSDFDKGTIRIKKGGCYRLKESISFEPLGGCCDYWPRFRTSNEDEYPMGPYALGFFAAITIEADNVVLDLNNHTIEASLEFALKQRFFNVIQFSSRVFEAHDGMDILNLQNGEPLAVQGRSPDENEEDEDQEPALRDLEESTTHCKGQYPYLNQPNRPPMKVILRNGVVGRSSHNGIHGNGGPRYIVIEDITARDFEVAGIQFNGAKDLIIRRCTVGPSGKSLVNGLFSSTRFIGFWVFFYYKELWTSEEKKVLLKENYITFADRKDPIRMLDVFERLFLAEQLLVEELEGPHEELRAPPDAGEDPIFDAIESKLEELMAATADGDLDNWNEKQQILAEARQIFLTDDQLPDGGSMYGINLHRRRKGVHRLGEEDWNFYGPDEDSTVNVTIYDTIIRNLTIASVEIPALKHTNGLCTGGTGEIVRITDWADYDGQISMRKPARYRGNMHSDAMIAFFKLANDFWQYSVWGIVPNLESGGSFQGPLSKGDENHLCGLNKQTILNPPTPPADCPEIPKGPRACEDLGVLHKQFFGSVKFSMELYEWASAGLPTGLGSLFESASELEERRTTEHSIACGGDTMHHFSKGVIGFKADFGDSINVWNMTVVGLTNKGDQTNYFCENQWRLHGTGQLLGPSSIEYKGTDVQGAVITKSFNVSLMNISLDYLYSEEGRAIGVDLIGDENGRSQYRVNYHPKANIRLENVTVGSHLNAGRGGDLSPIIGDTMSFDLGGFKVSEGPNLPNTWNAPRTLLTLFPSTNDPPVPASQNDLSMADLDLSEAEEYLKTYYGINASGTLKAFKETGGNSLKTLCYSNYTCVLPTESEVTDVYLTYVSIPGQQVGGSYRKCSTTNLEVGDELRVGALVIQNLARHGPIVIHYYSLNPERVEELPVHMEDQNNGVINRTKRTFEYELYSSTFGHGRAVGVVLSTYANGGWTTSGTSLFLFDDQYQNFQLYSSDDVTTLEDVKESVNNYQLYMDTRADGRLVVFTPLSEDTAPLTAHYFLTHEAGVKDMRRWLNETDAQIEQRRLEFAEFLSDRFGIESQPFDKNLAKWVDNDVAGILPYTANHDTDLRLTSIGNETFAEYQTTARLIEVGFLYKSGLGLIKQGVYVIEHPCDAFRAVKKINFRTVTPSSVSLLGHTVIHEQISYVGEDGAVTYEGVYEAVSLQYSGNQNSRGIHKEWDIVGSFKVYK